MYSYCADTCAERNKVVVQEGGFTSDVRNFIPWTIDSQIRNARVRRGNVALQRGRPAVASYEDRPYIGYVGCVKPLQQVADKY